MIDLRLCIESQEKPDSFCDQFENIHQQFSRFEPFADRDNLDVVSFYARTTVKFIYFSIPNAYAYRTELVRGYLFFKSKESVAKELIDTHLLFDMLDRRLRRAERKVAAPEQEKALAAMCRQLEGRHCLAALEHGMSCFCNPADLS